MHQQVQRVEQADGARKSSGTPTAVAAPAPKLEYVKLPGTKGALMIKAVETSKKRSVLCTFFFESFVVTDRARVFFHMA